MRLTTHTDYSLRVLIYLGAQHESGRLATVKDLAMAYGISQHHLRMVMHKLAKLGFVQTIQGKGGGCRLARAPERIGVGEVVRGTEPDFHIVECFAPNAGDCRITRACTLKHMLAEAQRNFLATLDRYTVADMIKQRRSVVRLLRIAA
jgi:Rrf2 family nitric oxide-sensitive transcriptional repressor